MLALCPRSFGSEHAELRSGERLTHPAVVEPASWEAMKDFWDMSSLGGDRKDSMISFFQQEERYRELGWSLWRTAPLDPRRWEWILDVLSYHSRCWKDKVQAANALADWKPELAEIDAAATAQWAVRSMELRAAFLASPEVADDLKWKLRVSELTNRLNEVRVMRRRGVESDLVALENDFFSFAASSPDSQDQNCQLIAGDLWATPGRDTAHESSLVQAFLSSTKPSLQWLGQGKARVVLLREKPIDLSLETLDGQILDMSELRGKVVLLDFWSITCGGCVSQLPEIKAIYDRYHAKGFEVVGVCFDDFSDREKVAAVLQKANIPWLNSIQGRLKRGNAIGDRFGIDRVPMAFLLGRDGRLVQHIRSSEQLENGLGELLHH